MVHAFAMDDSNIESLSPYRLLVINSRGYLRELYCPFRVMCMETLPSLPCGTRVFVDEVTKDRGTGLLYRINGSWYRHQHFTITIHF
jgi:hypothetical protein